jgi:hypothetical protein
VVLKQLTRGIPSCPPQQHHEAGNEERTNSLRNPADKPMRNYLATQVIDAAMDNKMRTYAKCRFAESMTSCQKLSSDIGPRTS